MITEDLNLKHSRVIIFLLSILCILAIGLILIEGKSIFIPLAVAVYLTLIINPIISFFENKGIPRFISIFLTLIVLLSLTITIGGAIGQSVQSFQKKLPLYENRINNIVFEFQSFFNVDVNQLTGETSWKQNENIMAFFNKLSFTNIFAVIIASLTSFLSYTFLIFLFILFLLMGKNNLVKKIERSFPVSVANRVTTIVTNISKKIQRYIIAKTIISLITATLVMIVLSIFGVEFVLIWGLLTFLLNFIPNIGSIVSTVLPVIITLVQFEDPMTSLWVFLILLGIQVIIGNILDPKFVGKSIHVSPMTVLISLLIWGWLWGVLGMFLSVPITVMLKIIFENIPELKFLSTLMEE